MIEEISDPINTLLIDDTPEKAMYNPEYTCISPKSFQGDPDDVYLEQTLRPYLEGLVDFPGTVQEYVQNNPLL